MGHIRTKFGPHSGRGPLFALRVNGRCSVYCIIWFKSVAHQLKQVPHKHDKTFTNIYEHRKTNFTNVNKGTFANNFEQ